MTIPVPFIQHSRSELKILTQALLSNRSTRKERSKFFNTFNWNPNLNGRKSSMDWINIVEGLIPYTKSDLVFVCKMQKYYPPELFTVTEEDVL